MDIVRDAYEGRVHYDYSDADGYGFLAELDGEPVGVILFWLGRPETWIRELAVRPTHRASLAVSALIRAVGYAAQAYGSRALAGMLSNNDDAGINLRTGASLQPKILARYRLADPRVQRFLTKPSNVPSS